MDVEPFERLQNDASCMASLAKGLVAGPMEVMESICKFVINAEKSDELSDEGKIQILKSMKGICRSISKSMDEKYGLTAAFKSELRGSELEEARMLFYYTVMKAFRNEMEKRRHRNPDSEHDAVRKMKLQLMNLDKEISQLKQQLSLYNRVKKRINQSKLSTQGIDENRTDVEKNLFQRDFRTMMIAIQTMLRQHNIATTRHVKKLETKNDIASKAIFDATENINRYSQLLHRILEKSNWYKDETISSESATPSEVVDASKICDENIKATETTESLAKDEMVVSDVASAKTIVDTSDKHVDAVCEVAPKDAYDSEVVEQVDDELDATGVDKGVESEAALVAGSEPLSVTAEDLISEVPNPEADAEVILAQETEKISPISHEAVEAAVEHDEPAAPMGEDVNDKSVTEEVEPSAMLSEEAVEEGKTTAEVEEVATEVKEAAMVSKAVIKRDISISMQSTIDHNADEDIVATNSMESVNQEMAGDSNLAVDSASDDAVEESVDENVDSVENTPVLETPEPLNASLERSDEPTENVPEVANEISEETVANEISEETAANEISEEVVAKETSEEVVANETSEEVVAKETSEEVVAKETSEATVANEISEEVVANEPTEDVPEVANEISEETVANESFDVDTTNVASCPSPDLAEVCDMSSGETYALSAPEENVMPIAEEESVIPLSTRNVTLSEPAEVSMPPHPQASPLPENNSSSVPVGMPMESDVTPVESTSLALDTDLDIITNTDAEEPTQETERTADEENDVNYSMEDDVSERVENEVSATTITINKNPSLFKIKLEIDTNELWNEIQNLKRDIVDLKDTLMSLKFRVNVPESGDKMVDEIPPLSEAEAVDDNADVAIIDNTVTETSNNENVSFVEREITIVDESSLEEGSHMAVVDDTNVEEPSQTSANVLDGELHEDVETELVTESNESLENVVDSELEGSKEDVETLKPEDANLVAGDSEGSYNAENTNDTPDLPENDTEIVVSPVEESEVGLNNLVVELDKSTGDFVGGARDVDTPYHSAFFDVPSTPVESVTPTPYEQPNQTIYFDAETFGSYITAGEVAENKDSLTTPNVEASLDVTENADGNANDLMSNENNLETAITNENTATDANEHGEVGPTTEETNISDEPEITNPDCDLEAEMLHETEEQAEMTVESEEIDETVNAEVDTISAVDKEANAHEMHHDSLSDVPSTHEDANEGLTSVESTDNLLTKEEDVITPGANETERGDITRPTSSDNCPKPTERTEEAASTSVMGVENTARSDILDDDEFVKEIIDELGSLDKADDEALLRELEELYTIMTQQLVYGTTTGSLDDEASSCMSLEASDNEEEFDNGRFKQRKAGRISDPSNLAESASENLKNTRALNQYNEEESTAFFNGLGATAAVQEENTVTTKGLPFFVGIFSQIPQLSQPISTETIEKQYEEFKQFQAFISLSSRKNQNEV